MKKAIIVLVSMLLVTLISVASLSAAFVYPGGYVKYYPHTLIKDKTTTTLIFNAQPDTAGVYDYKIYASVIGTYQQNNHVVLKTNTKEAYGIKYYSTQRTYRISAEANDGAYGLGIVDVFTSTHGRLSNYWYAN
ncbi:MAG: hypothetical protein GXY43_08450 [Clostridiaceae bacterium]|nr:hypothetical protein [Clostridiaceae bacterium]